MKRSYQTGKLRNAAKRPHFCKETEMHNVIRTADELSGRGKQAGKNERK